MTIHPHASDPGQRQLQRMESILTGFLRSGAFFASSWIGIGIALSAFENPASPSSQLDLLRDRCFTIGIGLLIALPVLRVFLMMLIFLCERDYRFVAISATVLIIIVVGFLLGTLHPGMTPL